MRKKYLSALLFGALFMASTVTFTSCKDYDDDIDNLNNKVSSVESAITAIQTQISNGGVITSVQSTANGVKVTLSNGNSFEVTNGTNGTNGKDGKDGSVVTIGDNGNWFIDGVDTGKPSRGEKGEPGSNGSDGSDGTTTTANSIYFIPGTAGAEAGYWVKVTVAADGSEKREVTTDKWAQEGAVTAAMSNDALILSGVTGANGPVVISLSAELKSLVFKPEFVLDGQNAMEYPYLPYNEITFSGDKSGTMDVENPTLAGVTGATASYIVKDVMPVIDYHTTLYINPEKHEWYHMNPWEANVTLFQNRLSVESGDKDFVELRGNDAAAKPSVRFVAANAAAGEQGLLEVAYTMQGQLVENQSLNPVNQHGIIFPEVPNNNTTKITSLALQAKLDNSEEITSNYASVYASRIAIEALAYQPTGAQPNNSISNNYIKNIPTADKHLYADAEDAAENAATVEIAWNNQNGINLHQLVSTHWVSNSQTSFGQNGAIQEWNTREELAKYNLVYHFEKVPFFIGSNKTSQSAHCLIEHNDDPTQDAVIFACGVTSQSDIDVEGFTDEQKKANAVGSIGRTPLIRVELRDNNGTPNDTTDDKIVKVGYIKFKITAPETPKWTSPFDYENYYYSCTQTVKKLTWHAIETKLLEDVKIQMSEQEFDAYYKLDAVSGSTTVAKQYVKTNRVDVNGQTIFDEYAFPYYLGTITEIRNNGAESTDVFKWEIDKQAFETFRAANYSDGVVTTESDYETVITYTRYVKYVPKNSSINHGVALEPIYLPMKVTLKYPKGELGNKLAAYWYDTNDLNSANNKPGAEMKEVHLNVEVPGTTIDGKAAACDFINDLDDAFMLNETLGHDGTLVRDNAPTFNVKKPANFPGFVDTELTYFYYFTAANAGRTVAGNSGTTYTLSVGDTTPIRYNNWGTPSEAHNTKLYASTVQIAEIDPVTGKITYLNNAVAKDILNRPEVLLPQASTDRLTNALTIELGVAAFNQCDILLPLDNATFDAKVLKPVYIDALGPVEYTNAVDGTEPGAIAYLGEMVKLTDWRERVFTSYNANAADSYYKYYEVESMTVDTQAIRTNLSGQMLPLSQVSNGVEFHFTAGTGLAGLPNLRNAYGSLKYFNRTGNVVSFDIEIPVKVTYKWGTITVWVRGSVNRTTGNN